VTVSHGWLMNNLDLPRKITWRKNPPKVELEELLFLALCQHAVCQAAESIQGGG